MRLRPFVILILTILSAPALAGPSGLRSGVGRIAAPGVPGPFSIVGDEAFPVVCAKGDGFLQPVVVAARYGRGRVVALGHTGYLSADALGRHDTGRLVTNAVRWAGKGPIGVLSLPGAAAFLAGKKFDVRPLSPKDLPAKLKGIAVLCLKPSQIRDETRIEAIRGFLEKGGGLIAADLGWGWKQLNPGKDLPTEHPGNRLLAPAGIVWTAGYLDAPGRKGYAVDAPPETAHAGRALDALLRGAGNKAHATAVVTRAAASLPLSDPFLLPRLRKLPKDRADLARIRLAFEIAEAKRLPARKVRAHPSAAAFPGAVPKGAKRVDRTVTVDLSVPGWASTGLYAPAGEVVTIRGKPGLRVRIGAHRDHLYRKKEWRRPPEISFAWPLDTKETEVASPFGGLLYFEVPDRGDSGERAFVVSGAVGAPFWVDGVTDVATWRKRIRKRPAPWAELATDKVILTVPSRVIRDLDDPRPLMAFWNEVLDACADLSGRPKARKRPERYVTDVQISAGYMHAGYPIMTHLDVAPVVVDLVKMKAGRWGLFHEIGHNHQSRDWTFDGTGEVTVNLFTLYILDHVCGEAAKGHGALSPKNRKKMMDEYFAGGADFAIWKRKPFLALLVYVQIVEEFGWEPFRKVFREYRDLPNEARPKTDDEKRDQWLVRMSRTVGRNLGPLFSAWGIPTSAAARASIERLPGWMPEGLPTR